MAEIIENTSPTMNPTEDLIGIIMHSCIMLAISAHGSVDEVQKAAMCWACQDIEFSKQMREKYGNEINGLYKMMARSAKKVRDLKRKDDEMEKKITLPDY